MHKRIKSTIYCLSLNSDTAPTFLLTFVTSLSVERQRGSQGVAGRQPRAFALFKKGRHPPAGTGVLKKEKRSDAAMMRRCRASAHYASIAQGRSIRRTVLLNLRRPGENQSAQQPRARESESKPGPTTHPPPTRRVLRQYGPISPGRHATRDPHKPVRGSPFAGTPGC